MKLDEYKALLKKATDADKAPEALSEILKAVTDDTAQIEALTSAHAEDEKKIRELQDTNMRLFLAQTAQPEVEKEEPEVTPQSIAEAMFKKGEK